MFEVSVFIKMVKMGIEPVTVILPLLSETYSFSKEKYFKKLLF